MAKGNSEFSQESYETVGDALSQYMTRDGGIFKTPSSFGGLFWCLDYLDSFCSRIGYHGGTYPSTVRAGLENDFREINEKIDSILKALDSAAERVGHTTKEATKKIEKTEDKQDLNSGKNSSSTNRSASNYTTTYTTAGGVIGTAITTTSGTSSINNDKTNSDQLKNTGSKISSTTGVSSTTSSIDDKKDNNNQTSSNNQNKTDVTDNSTSNEQIKDTTTQQPDYIPSGTEEKTDNNATAAVDIATPTPIEGTGIINQPTQGSNYSNNGNRSNYSTNTQGTSVSEESSIGETVGASVVESAKDLLDGKTGNTKSKITIPKSSSSNTTTTSSSSKGFNPIPLAVGLGAAVAGGIGIKAYKDHKENSGFDDENEDSLTNGNRFWTEEDPNVINSEQNEISGDDLFLNNNAVPAYEASDNGNNDTWSIDEPIEENNDTFDLLGEN